MLGAAWQGEGPYVGLLSYYGGLYPMAFGGLAGLLGVSFDLALSIADSPAAASCAEIRSLLVQHRALGRRPSRRCRVSVRGP